MPNETSSKSPRPSIPTGPEELLLLPLPDAVLFPGTIVQIELRSAALAEELASKPDAPVAVFTRKAATGAGEVSADQLYEVGAIADVIHIVRQPVGAVVLLRGAAPRPPPPGGRRAAVPGGGWA